MSCFRTEDVAAYFDRLAPEWDSGLVRKEDVIREILDRAGVSEGKSVLDVGCGTGVLVRDYLDLNAGSVTAVDVSAKMLEIAASRFRTEKVRFVCADAARAEFGRQFDCIVIYNSFPHFPDPEGLIRILSGKLLPGGTLTVAHGMSRERVNARHRGAAGAVSNGLMPAEELAALMGQYLRVGAVVSDERMYLVTGTRRDPDLG